MTRELRRADPALLFFAAGALACLLVSIPATAAAMEIFHGARWGRIATGVFEFGAVGLELMGLWIPQWRKRLLLSMLLMLLITTAFNYALGVDAYISAALLPGTTYAAIRAHDYGWLLTIAASALFPAMLGGFLLGFTARARMVMARFGTPMSVIAFWLAAHWQSLNSAEQRVNTAEHARALAEQYVKDYEQRVNSAEQVATRLRQELSTRPAPLTIEVVRVARYQLTYEQLATLAGASVSTIRRRLPELVNTIEQEAS